LRLEIIKKKINSREYVELLKKYKELYAILLFGSFLKDSINARDVDLALVGNLTELQGLELFPKLQKLFEKELDIVVLNISTNDILGYEIFSNSEVLYVVNKDGLASIFSCIIRKHDDEKRFRAKSGLN